MALAPRLAALFPERGAAEWWKYLQEGRRTGKRYLWIAKAISQEKKDSLAELPVFDLPRYQGGAIYESFYTRRYPYGGLAKRVIGHAIQREHGHVGIEGKYDNFLQETDVRLSLSMEMQALADSTLRAAIEPDEDIEAACVIIMDVRSGAIKTMVNLSRRGGSEHLWECYNDAIAHSYEPGAVLQTMTLASILRDGYISSLPNLDDFATDSRTAMSELATKYYENSELYYTEGIRSFCLPRRMNFDVDGLREVDITKPGGYYWQEGTLANMANGFCMTMTPLDILSFYNTIANGGQMARPYLVEAVGRGDDTFTPHNPAPDIIRKDVLSKEVTASLRRALEVPGHTMAAKTGAARQVIRPNYDNGHEQNPYEDNEGRYQTAATCVGFFPVAEPRYSIMCVLFSYPCKTNYHGDGIPCLVVNKIRKSCENTF